MPVESPIQNAVRILQFSSGGSCSSPNTVRSDRLLTKRIPEIADEIVSISLKPARSQTKIPSYQPLPS